MPRPTDLSSSDILPDILSDSKSALKRIHSNSDRSSLPHCALYIRTCHSTRMRALGRETHSCCCLLLLLRQEAIHRHAPERERERSERKVSALARFYRGSRLHLRGPSFLWQQRRVHTSIRSRSRCFLSPLFAKFPIRRPRHKWDP